MALRKNINNIEYDLMKTIEMTAEKEKEIKETASKFGLRLLILFGSRAKGKLHKESDYDVAYLSNRGLSFEDEGRLIIELKKIIGVPDERLINLVNMHSAGPLLLKEIFNAHRTLFKETNNTYDTYKIYSLKNYLDSRPIFELRDSLINRYFTKHAK